MKAICRYIILSLCLSLLNLSALERIEYTFSHDLIDVVIPCHEKDFGTLTYVVEGIKSYIPHNRIFVVSRNKPIHQTIRITKVHNGQVIQTNEKLLEHVEFIDECLYPFTKDDIAFEILQDRVAAAHFIEHPKSRIGWIYQQFLKLYAPYVIPDISSNVLIVDADTIFMHRTVFQDELGAPLFNVGTEYIIGYFDCIQRLIPGLKKVFPSYSGICHHMLFQKTVLDDLFGMIEKIHEKAAWKAICHVIDHEDLYKSCFSEYELYFNFIFSRSMQPKLRILKWENVSMPVLHTMYNKGYDYVSCHSWMG